MGGGILGETFIHTQSSREPPQTKIIKNTYHISISDFGSIQKTEDLLTEIM